MQECGAGLVRVRRTGDGLAFAAPPLVRSGPVDDAVVAHIADVLGIAVSEIVDAQWVDNGPGWVAVLLADAAAVLALRPAATDLDIGVVGPYPPGSPAAVEVRAFTPADGATVEDPVTGSLNASLAEWLLRTGRVRRPTWPARAPHSAEPAGCTSPATTRQIWVAGGTVTCVTGEVDL